MPTYILLKSAGLGSRGVSRSFQTQVLDWDSKEGGTFGDSFKRCYAEI